MNALLSVPYFSQADNEGCQGWHECASSSTAMLAAYYGKVATEDAFNQVRRRHGESTDISAQTRALAELGLQPLFRTDGDWMVVKHHIDMGKPIILPYLHRGHVSKPSEGHHWAVCIGIQRDTLTIHDPKGEPDLVFGGHFNDTTGKAVRCTRRNFGRRWMVEGSGSGFYLTCL